MSADVIAAVLAERMSKGTSGRYIAAFTETPETLAAAIAAALTPTREDEAARAVLAPLDALLARWQLHGDTDWSKSALIDQFQQALAAARAEANRAGRIESTEARP